MVEPEHAGSPAAAQDSPHRPACGRAAEVGVACHHPLRRSSSLVGTTRFTQVLRSIAAVCRRPVWHVSGCSCLPFDLYTHTAHIVVYEVSVGINEIAEFVDSAA